MRRFALATVCAAGAFVAVAAQAPSPAGDGVVVSSTLERIVAAPDEAGQTEVQIAPTTVASPADQLIVSVRFTNASDAVVDSVRVTSPVPADVQYVAGSASGPGSDVLFSADSGRTFGLPNELMVAAATGGMRAATPADYTHVRWVLRAPLDPGATGIARFRAVPR